MEFLLQNPTALFGVIALVILFLAIFIMDKKENRKKRKDSWRLAS